MFGGEIDKCWLTSGSWKEGLVSGRGWSSSSVSLLSTTLLLQDQLHSMVKFLSRYNAKLSKQNASDYCVCMHQWKTAIFFLNWDRISQISLKDIPSRSQLSSSNLDHQTFLRQIIIAWYSNGSLCWSPEEIDAPPAPDLARVLRPLCHTHTHSEKV